MIHGFRGTHHGLLPVAKHLKGYHIVVPDLPGFGEGPVLTTYDLDSFVSWLHRFIQRLNSSQPPVLLGHSFGSIICAAYSAKYPDTIAKLILVNPIGAPALEGPKKSLTQLARLYYRIGARLPHRLATPWLSAKPMVRIMSITMAKTPNKELRRFIHSQHATYFSRFSSPQSVLESFQTSIQHTVAEFAHAIPTRTLLIVGSLDDITPLSVQYSLVKRFPRATIKVIDNVGHLTHYETPEQVARYVQAFTKLP